MQELGKAGAEHLLRTFVISEQEASAVAADYLDLIEAKGGDPRSFSSDTFNALLTKQLAQKYKWRDPGAKVAWESRQEDGVRGYSDFLSSRRSSPFKRW